MGLGWDRSRKTPGLIKTPFPKEQSYDGQSPESLCLWGELRVVVGELEWECVGAKRQKERGR